MGLRDSRKAHAALLFVGLVVVILLIAGLLVYQLFLSGSSGAVMTLTTTSTVYEMTEVNSSPPSINSNFSSANGLNAESIYRYANESIVTVQGSSIQNVGGLFGGQNVTEQDLGSGFVIDYLGSYYIVTNYHVVQGDTNLTVTFWNGDAYPARVKGFDAYGDLSILTIASARFSEFHPLQIATSSELTVGQPVVAIGNPFGLAGSMTLGIISQLGRTIQDETAGNFSIADVIQFSAPINPGNSGGPLLDQYGQVVGITTAAVGGSQGVGFAIPSDTILREIPSLINSGTYNSHPYLGIEGADMNYELAQAIGTNVTYGVLVESLVPGGPADNSGLRAGNQAAMIEGNPYEIGGDVIISMNGTRILNTDSLATYLEENTLPGQNLSLGIIRSGAFTTVNVVIGVRPPLSSG